MSKMKRVMWSAMAFLSLTACSVKNETQDSGGKVKENRVKESSERLESALGRFGSTSDDFNRFLATGDDAWLKRVRDFSQREYTGSMDIIALRQITSHMAEQNAPPERFLQVCMETDLLVPFTGDDVYPYDQWHTAVCNRGAVVSTPYDPPR